MYKLVVFDVDGTLCESRKKADDKMISLLNDLSKISKIAFFSGADKDRIKSQIGKGLDFYPYIGEYSAAHIFRQNMNICDNKLTLEEQTNLGDMIGSYWKEGMFLEISDYQVTLYLVDPKSSNSVRNKADPDLSIRKALIEKLNKYHYMSEFEIRIGGKTSIDFNKEGVCKKTGVDALKKHLNLKFEDVLFIGDRCFEGGNDWMEGKHLCIPVDNPEETKEIIRGLLEE